MSNSTEAFVKLNNAIRSNHLNKIHSYPTGTKLLIKSAHDSTEKWYMFIINNDKQLSTNIVHGIMNIGGIVITVSINIFSIISIPYEGNEGLLDTNLPPITNGTPVIVKFGTDPNHYLRVLSRIEVTDDGNYKTYVYDAVDEDNECTLVEVYDVPNNNTSFSYMNDTASNFVNTVHNNFYKPDTFGSCNNSVWYHPNNVTPTNGEKTHE